MAYSLRVATGPTVEPVTLEEVKTHAHIDHDVEDELVERWIVSAREIAEDYQHRSYLQQTYDMYMDKWPTSPFCVPRAPLVSVTHIKYYGTDNTEYTLYDSVTTEDVFIDTQSEPGRISLSWGLTWPTTTLRPINGVWVRFISGYGDNETMTPATVKDAILLYCTYRNENREAEAGEAPPQFYNLLRPRRIYTP